MKQRGRFITLEGGEGVGKSTNLEFLEQTLRQKGLPVVVTREPGGTSTAERIRSLLLDKDQGPLALESELLLVFAARADHLKQVICPALEQGSWVLCDRFTDATYAYQGGGRGMNPAHIEYLELWIQQGLQPDLTLLFDAPVNLGMSRVVQRGERDRFEVEEMDFFERIRQAYLDRAGRNPGRIRVIDAGRPIEEVKADVLRIVLELA
ncbi:MAG: dTMP kinase [Methylococcus sp.]|nr:MAG: dTMP kinase [Methylococcus sp.]